MLDAAISGVTSSNLPVGEYPTFLSVLATPTVYPHMSLIAPQM